MSIRVTINPGTGDVPNASREAAESNIAPLLDDAGVSRDAVTVEYESDPSYEDGGRFVFVLKMDGRREMKIAMPGLPLGQVRYTGVDGQKIRHFPRLYVDDSSWVWEYAVPSVRRWAEGTEDND